MSWPAPSAAQRRARERRRELRHAPTLHTGVVPSVRRCRFAPLWVYFFGLFALLFTQRLVFPPAEHSTGANVAFFAVGAILVVAALTVAERATRR